MKLAKCNMVRTACEVIYKRTDYTTIRESDVVAELSVEVEHNIGMSTDSTISIFTVRRQAREWCVENGLIYTTV